MIKGWLVSLALTAAVAASSVVLLAEGPVRADSCFGSCSMQVPTNCSQWGTSCYYACSNGTCTLYCGPHGTCQNYNYVTISTNCVLMGAPDSGAPCACPYEGNPNVNNGCPDPKP
jgi:hypothetical protein